ncbi:MAG: IS110 family transposase [Micrococcales bacterium]|nr:IS110 family transposase [Micrococcales bacterium]
MSIVAHAHPFVIGVDTHARNHVLAVLKDTGEHVDTASFPASAQGLERAVGWAARRTGGDLAALWVVEGAGSYGAGLARAATSAGYQVLEAPRMAQARPCGRSDPLDARRIAAAALVTPHDQLRRPRADDGVRAAVQVLLTARDSMARERTAAVNALTALLRTADLGIDARRPLGAAQVRQAAAWTDRPEPVAAARTEARRLAQRVLDLADHLKENQTTLAEHVQASPAATLLDHTGVGPVSAAVALTAWSHPGRVRDEAAFAALAGTSPLPASSGNTTRHRLNRSGDRRLNRALHTIVLTRARCDPDTQAYITRRTREGLTRREILRCLKRYLARHIYRTLNAAATA